MSSNRSEVIVIGGGQAGVSLAYFLRQRHVSHVVLERDRRDHQADAPPRQRTERAPRDDGEGGRKRRRRRGRRRGGRDESGEQPESREESEAGEEAEAGEEPEGEADADNPGLPPPSGAKPGETVLVVDDEAVVRMLIGDVLRDLGYELIEAADGAEALHVLQSKRSIDLLVSDVGLPGGMNGRQLADAARAQRPQLKVLFITGHAENTLLGNGVLDPDMQVLAKPFALDALAAKVRAMM